MENNELKENIRRKVKEKIAISNISKEFNVKNNDSKKVIYYISSICASLFLISGIVFAINIESTKRTDRGLGDGVETAIENEYIAEPKAKFTNIDNSGLEIKLENFLMDDTNLSVNLVFLLDDKLNNTINLDKIYEVELKDLIIRDEENRILYDGCDEERFKAYCDENNLTYKFGEFNDNYMNSGVGCFIETKGKGNVNLLYNMYSDNFPRSKVIYFSLTKILLKELDGENYIVNGNWELTVDVPEKMYNRTEEYYKVTSCSNNDFEVYVAKVTDTGFEFGVIISNIEKKYFDPYKLTEAVKAQQEYPENKITKEEYDEYRKYYLDEYYYRNPICTSSFEYNGEKLKPSYIENEKGEKFENTGAAGRRASYKFLDDNKYDFCETFSMTKYNATDKIKAVLYYYGNQVIIELEKNNK